jgi:hypothetical protein
VHAHLLYTHPLPIQCNKETIFHEDDAEEKDLQLVGREGVRDDAAAAAAASSSTSVAGSTEVSEGICTCPAPVWKPRGSGAAVGWGGVGLKGAMCGRVLQT